MSLNKSEHENHRIPQDAQIAQLVEQRTENPRVTGSIPVQGTWIYKDSYSHGFHEFQKNLKKTSFSLHLSRSILMG